MIVRIGYVDILTAIYGKAGRNIELTIASAKTAELELEIARRVEDLNASVKGISNVDVLAAINRDAFRNIELTVTKAIASEREL